MSTKEKSVGGWGVGTVLFFIFLVLKLTGNIDWSWWWVTSPLWIPIALVVAIFLIIALFTLIISFFNGR
jgi:hypothetical protein